MNGLYKYSGLISSLTCSEKRMDIVLYDIADESKAPTQLKVFGGLAKYIYEIEMTDAEERFITSDYYFDRNLFLYRIEVPSKNELIPAKIITQADFLSEELVIFGPQTYIETSAPVPMDNDQISSWYDYRFIH